jgi:hypothetical protein
MSTKGIHIFENLFKDLQEAMTVCLNTKKKIHTAHAFSTPKKIKTGDKYETVYTCF